MSEDEARFREKAVECDQQAKKAIKPHDKETWLRLAQDWLKLAQAADGKR